MATLVGVGYIEVVPRLAPGFSGAMAAQMGAAGKAGAAASAVSMEKGGAAAGAGFLGGMRRSLAGMSGMVKGVGAIFAAVGIEKFAKASVDAFKEVAGSSLTLQRIMGGTITQASEWSAVTSRFGISTGQMSVSMKTLAKDMVSGKGPLVALGIASRDTSGHLRPMGDVMMDVADKFKTMPDGAGKSRLAVELFGKQGLALLPILNRGSGGIQELMDTAKKLGLVLDGNATDKMKKAATAQRDLNEAVKGLEVQFGQKLIPILTKFVQFLGTSVMPVLASMMGWMERNSTAVKILGIALLTLWTYTKLTSIATAVGVAAMKGWAAACKIATAAQWLWNAALAANPIGIVVVAIAAAVAAVILLWTHWDQVWNWISHHKAYAIIIAILAGSIVLPIFALVAAGKFLQKHWQEIWAGIQNVTQIVAHSLIAAFEAVQRAWNTVWGAMSIVIVPIWNVIKAVVGAGMTALRAVISVGMAVIRAVWGPAWAVMSTTFSVAWTVIRTIATVGMTLVRTAIQVGMAVIRAVWGPAWAVISTLASAAWVVIRTVVQVGMTLVRGAIEVGMAVIRAVWGPAWAVISTLAGAAWVVIRTVVAVGMTLVRGAIEVGMAVVRAVWGPAWAVISTLASAAWVVIRTVVSIGMTLIRTAIEVGMAIIRPLWNRWRGPSWARCSARRLDRHKGVGHCRNDRPAGRDRRRPNRHQGGLVCRLECDQDLLHGIVGRFPHHGRVPAAVDLYVDRHGMECDKGILDRDLECHPVVLYGGLGSHEANASCRDHLDTQYGRLGLERCPRILGLDME